MIWFRMYRLFLIKQNLVIMKSSYLKESKDRMYRYTYESDELDKVFNIQKEPICANCANWQSKTKELIWGYEQLTQAKEKELEALTEMIGSLDDEIRKLKSRNQGLVKRTEKSDMELQSVMVEHLECKKVIKHYKDREVELLCDLKAVENQLFTKTIQVKDEIELKEILTPDKHNYLSKSMKFKQFRPTKTQANLSPALKSSKSVGKLLERSLVQIQKMGRQKLVTELKHRMAVLKATELAVLK